MTFTAPDLDPEEVNYFQTRRRNARTAYSRGLARNVFDRGQLDLTQSRGREDMIRAFDQARERLPGGFAGRGLLNSGIYQAKLGEYGADRIRTSSRFEQDALGQRNQLQLGADDLDAIYNSANEDIGLQEAARRQNIAAQLRGLT